MWKRIYMVALVLVLTRLYTTLSYVAYKFNIRKTHPPACESI
jgi:hypothetical protein